MSNQTQAIIKQFDTIQNIVRQVMIKQPETRDCDKLLLLKVWEAQGIKINLTTQDIKGLYTPESISRSRRKIQNDNCELIGKRKEERITREKNIRQAIVWEAENETTFKFKHTSGQGGKEQ